jgi:hypothetical protein
MVWHPGLEWIGGIGWAARSDWFPSGLFGLWAIEAWLTRSRLRDLPGLPEAGPGSAASAVTLCIPARDEERELGAALDSWLAQDHPGLRILVVDDDSTDRTPELLAERQAREPGRLRVIRNRELPPGWLGKNHALHLASGQPEAMAADWLLFTDADVQAAPDLLRRAFAFLEENPADLLTLLPGIDTVSLAERVFLPLGNLFFLWLVPPGRVADPRSRACCGVGGFILVRRRAYDAVAGHAGAPMAVVDDMVLAHRVKAAGFRIRMAQGGPLLHLRMYHGLGAIIHGLRKNLLAFPVLVYFVPLLLAAVILATLGCALAAMAGHWVAGLLLWLLVPPLMAEAQQRLTGQPVDLAWALWPLAGLMVSASLLLATADRLRGVNRWRGREVRL